MPIDCHLKTVGMKRGLTQAVKHNNVDKVDKMLTQDRLKNNLNVNWQDRHGMTALHHACIAGYYKITKLLLTHPDINVNCLNNNGATAFSLASFNGRESCAQLLLTQHQLKPNLLDGWGHHPLQSIVNRSYINTLRLWIAAVDSSHPNSPYQVFADKSATYDTARQQINHLISYRRRPDNEETISLFIRYNDKPEQVRLEVVTQLGRHRQLVAELFAVVIFFCDGLLQISENKNNTTAKVTRFFKIAIELPIELQMVLCCRVFGSALNNIKSCDSESGFYWLASKYLSN